MRISCNRWIWSILFLYSACSATFLTLHEPKYKGSLDLNFLAMLKNVFNVDCFVETGTHTGNTVIRASTLFPENHTIELYNKTYEGNLLLFSKYPTIRAHFGESSQTLDSIIPLMKRSSIAFFLDAHYCGDGTAKGNSNTPLIEELRVIGSYNKTAIIIIDDLRMCQPDEQIVQKQLTVEPQCTAVAGYPSITQLRDITQQINPDYEFIIWGDLAFIYPKDKYPHIELSPVLTALTKSRFFEESKMHTIDETIAVIEAEKTLINITPNEKYAIQQLLNPATGLWHPALFTPHYRLWNALMCISDQQYDKARTLLNEAYSLGLTHWRVVWYLAQVHNKLNNKQEADCLLAQIEHELAQANNMIYLLK